MNITDLENKKMTMTNIEETIKKLEKMLFTTKESNDFLSSKEKEFILKKLKFVQRHVDGVMTADLWSECIKFIKSVCSLEIEGSVDSIAKLTNKNLLKFWQKDLTLLSKNKGFNIKINEEEKSLLLAVDIDNVVLDGFELGNYVVTIDVSFSEDLRCVVCLKNDGEDCPDLIDSDGSLGFIHPHASINGILCMGGQGSAILNKMSSDPNFLDFIEIVDTVESVIRNYIPDDAYAKFKED